MYFRGRFNIYRLSGNLVFKFMLTYIKAHFSCLHIVCTSSKLCYL